MNIIATAATLLPTVASGEDISPDAKRDLAKNFVSPERTQCLGPSRESSKMEARKVQPWRSSLEGGAPYDGRRDSFRRRGYAGAIHSGYRRGHGRSSDDARRHSYRSRNDTGRKHRVGHTPPHNRRPRDSWGRRPGFRERAPFARTTVSQPGTVRLRDTPEASAVVGIVRRSVFQSRRRVLGDSELDDDSSGDQRRL